MQNRTHETSHHCKSFPWLTCLFHLFVLHVLQLAAQRWSSEPQGSRLAADERNHGLLWRCKAGCWLSPPLACSLLVLPPTAGALANSPLTINLSILFDQDGWIDFYLFFLLGSVFFKPYIWAMWSVEIGVLDMVSLMRTWCTIHFVLNIHGICTVSEVWDAAFMIWNDIQVMLVSWWSVYGEQTISVLCLFISQEATASHYNEQ